MGNLYKLSPRNLQVGWGRAQRYYGKISLILMGDRSLTLWGRLGFENWLFKASKIGWTSCLGIVAIFQQVIMTLLGAVYVTPFLECGSSVALQLETNETKWEKSLEMVGPQRWILIFTTLLPSLVAGYCHWEPSVFHKAKINLILCNYFKLDESVITARGV